MINDQCLFPKSLVGNKAALQRIRENFYSTNTVNSNNGKFKSNMRLDCSFLSSQRKRISKLA